MQRYIINLSSGKALNPLHPGADSLPCHLPVGAAIRTWLGLLLRHTIHHPHGWFSAPSQIGVTVSGAFYKEIPWGKGPAREVCLQITLVLTLLLSVVTQQTQESMQPFLLVMVAFGMLWTRAGFCIGDMMQNSYKFCYFSNLHVFYYLFCVLLSRQICKTYECNVQYFYTGIGIRPEIQKTHPSLSWVDKY